MPLMAIELGNAALERAAASRGRTPWLAGIAAVLWLQLTCPPLPGWARSKPGWQQCLRVCSVSSDTTAAAG